MNIRNYVLAASIGPVLMSATALANDECVDAQLIEADSVTPWTTIGATDSGNQHDGSACEDTFYTGTGPDIWMKMELASGGLLSLSTCDSGSFDTDLALYHGDCGTLTVLSCNGDNSGQEDCQLYYSSISLEVTPGTYHIRIGGYNGLSGNGSLTSTFISNDDCDGDGIPDDQEPDCDSDGTPDDCENDCNDNDIPDKCEKGGHDCNDNGIEDSCDLANGTSSDLNGNDLPDECEATTIVVPFNLEGAIGAQCIADGPLLVNLNGIMIGAQVDLNFSNGGDNTWAADALICMENPDATGCIQIGGFNLDCSSGCANQAVFPGSWNVATSGEYSIFIPLNEFGFQGDGDYTFNICHGYNEGTTPTTWQGQVTFMYLPESFIDCNSNGIPDDTDIAGGDSTDCDINGVPDECQSLEDCDDNSIPDICQTDGDCNGNGTPDSCEEFADCNDNGTFDACETDNDCDANGTPDDCQKIDDCNDNGIFDACESGDDCNGNGTPDECELEGSDLDGNGVIDACEGPIADTCEDPLIIDPNSVTFFNNHGATPSGIADDDLLCTDTFYTGAEPDVWFFLNLDDPGNLDLSTCYLGSYDTDLSLYTGLTCDDLIKVACNGDAEPSETCQQFHSGLSYTADPGRYWIRIGGYNSAEGSGFLTMSFDGAPSSCNGDFTGDGIVNGADFGSLLAAWGPCTGCPEDLNGDNIVNGADVGLFLSLWGPCP